MTQTDIQALLPIIWKLLVHLYLIVLVGSFIMGIHEAIQAYRYKSEP